MLVVTNLLEGHVPIKSVEERLKNKFYTYGCDPLTRQIGLVQVERSSQKKEQLCCVKFDDGQVLICGVSAQIMLLGGSYRSVTDLRAGDAAAVFRRSEWSSDKHLHGSYRWIYVSKRGHVTEHRLVMEYLVGSDAQTWDGMVVHHRNFTREDNSFENLAFWEESFHLQYHKNLNERRWADPKAHEIMSNFAKERWGPTGDLRLALPEMLERRKNHPNYEKEIEAFRQRSIKGKYGTLNKGREDQKQLQNANADKDFTIDDVIMAFRPGMKWDDLCAATGQPLWKVRKRIRWAGYKTLEAFAAERGGCYQQPKKGFGNPNANTSFTFQDVCNAYRRGMTLAALAAAANSTTTIVNKRLKWEGYVNYADFVARYKNHKVVSVHFLNKVGTFYTLSTNKHNNFVVGQMVEGVFRGTVLKGS